MLFVAVDYFGLLCEQSQLLVICGDRCSLSIVQCAFGKLCNKCISSHIYFFYCFKLPPQFILRQPDQMLALSGFKGDFLHNI